MAKWNPYNPIIVKNRFYTSPWYAHGVQLPGADPNERFMNERAVRARAGLLMLISLFIMFVRISHADHGAEGQAISAGVVEHEEAAVAGSVVVDEHAFEADHSLNHILIFFVMYEMFVGIFFGLTPLSVTGVLGSLITWNQPPDWRPARPKKLAWSIGLLLGTFCQISLFTGQFMGLSMVALVLCVFFMWMEAAFGICVGCHMYLWIYKLTGKEYCPSCVGSSDPEPVMGMMSSPESSFGLPSD